MEWLIIGAILGGVGVWFSSLARSKNISIQWYVWIIGVLAVLLAALTALDYETLILEMEPATAGVVLWLFGGPALILALIAISLVWWHNRKTNRAPMKS
jgi:hypothetical protein